MAQPSDITRMEQIFHPYAMDKIKAFINGRPDGKVGFVHYTSAKAALSIIETKRIWMRNVTAMSDYSEVQYGRTLLTEVLMQDDRRNLKDFTASIDKCAEGAVAKALSWFDRSWNDVSTNTYVTCVSEHDSEKEDLHGRLSMWRAFGGSDIRVALVFKVPPSVLNLGVFNLVFSPVAYLGKQHVEAQLQRVTGNIEANRDYLRELGSDQLARSVYGMLIDAVTCLKHAGFQEEHEWRLIYAPARWPSPLIQRERETKDVGGIPQVIYKIPFDAGLPDAPEAIKALDFAQLFDRLIIGPTAHPFSMIEAFLIALQKSGIAEPRIERSGIPIRL